MRKHPRALLATLTAIAIGVALLVTIDHFRAPSADTVVRHYIAATSGDEHVLRDTSLAGRESPSATAADILRVGHSPTRRAPVDISRVQEDASRAVGADSKLFTVTGVSDGQAFTTQVRVTKYADTGWRVVAEVP